MPHWSASPFTGGQNVVQNTHIKDKEVADADAVEGADNTKGRGICVTRHWSLSSVFYRKKEQVVPQHSSPYQRV
uniref:Uncharacterized protein n=1 Tax=Cryptococcus bacillisporus CA1280 TaxID=1296109 RepID=A0A0D0VQ29_CRYGA|nr:hypothetical protein I312_01435 [Cryptococcus bacillisporus CA1280]